MTATPPGETGPAARDRLLLLRRLLSPLAQRRTLAVSLLFALALAPPAIVRPGDDEALPSAPHPTARPELACLDRLLPLDATVAFFTEANGTARLESPMPLYYSQSQLAPRLLVIRPPETWRTGDVDWFVGTLSDPGSARALADRHGLRVTGQCGPWTVLGRAP